MASLAEAYGRQWDNIYGANTAQLSREWHTSWERLRPVLLPYLQHAATSEQQQGTTATAQLEQQPAQQQHDEQAVTSSAPGSSPPAAPCAGGGPLVVDVGCGGSAFGVEVLRAGVGFRRLLLLDASSAVLEELLARHGAPAVAVAAVAAAGEPAAPAEPAAANAGSSSRSGGNVSAADGCATAGADGTERSSTHRESSQQRQQAEARPQPATYVELLRGDCRHLPLATGSAACVIDKGTLDALWSDEDKVSMLGECARVLSRPHGICISVSFSSRARLQLLERETARLGLAMRVHVVGEGDPARGHEVRFVTLLSHDFGPVPHTTDDLTDLVLRRLQRTGSLIADDDAEEEGQGAGAGGLFDD